MKKLIIALLLVPGYTLSMRTDADTTITGTSQDTGQRLNRARLNTGNKYGQAQKNLELLRREFYDLQRDAAEAQQTPEQAQARLSLVSKRLAALTQDIARSKTQAIRQNVRAQVQTRRQGTPDYAQSAAMQNYQILEQELQKFASNLNTMIVRAARASSRRYAMRARQGRQNVEQPTVRQANQATTKAQPSESTSSKKAAAPQLYTIDYTQE